MESPTFVLFEHATGYALFRLKEFEEVGQILPEVEEAQSNLSRFASVVKLVAFTPFQNTEVALRNCSAVCEGLLPEDLLNFLEANVVREKKIKSVLGVSDAKLGASISESLPYIKCITGGVVPEVLRGLRAHFGSLVKGLTSVSLAKSQLGLSHSYSRGKVKFDTNRVDNMIIQAIALLDQLDKDINTFTMRIREWYSYHFPELYKLVPDQFKYCQCATLIKDRQSLTDGATVDVLKEILNGDEQLVADIIEAGRSSMGMEISPVDMINVERFANRVVSLAEYRLHLQEYLKERMHSCAPSLSALIGEQVGARLISHAGSLTGLAKYPASTVQILGAEKALFRALKTKGNTPKYGLLFHSTFIGRAATKNKGRISRFLANKCSIASRVDCFSETPVSTFGEHLRTQVEDRLKYFETGQIPKKNLDVMREASTEATEAQGKVLKKQKKMEKKKRKLAEAAANQPMQVEPPEEVVVKKSKKKRKQRPDQTEEAVSEQLEPSPRKKKKHLEETPEQVEELVASPPPSTKKKKKKRESL